MRALQEGDQQEERSGSARDALRHPVFRRVFFGAFVTNIGSWMQMVVLAALAYDLTNSSRFVGLMIFAQLGPLMLSPIGGLLADRVDRSRLLITVSFGKLTLSATLAALVIPDQPNRAGLLAIVFGTGLLQAIYAPTFTALLPQLAGSRDMPAAVSLNSAQMNASRVIGPVLGAFLDSWIGAPAVFAATAVSYLFVIGALLSVQLPKPVVDANGSKGLRAIGDGIRVARRNPLIRQPLVTITTLSVISLPFIGQFPVLAERNLGVDERSTTYGLLYACFGVGAVVGALAIGTVFRSWPKPRIGRIAVFGFAGGLAVLSALRGPVLAFPVVAFVGFAYIALVTCLMTTLQEETTDLDRGRVMALWVMGWGGMVPVGNLIAGPFIEWTSMTTVMLVGAVWAVALGVYLRPRRVRPSAGADAAVLQPACYPGR